MTQGVDRAAWFEDELAFAAQLARGRRGEFAIASALLPTGRWLRVNSLNFRETFADRHDFHDETDLEIEGGHRIEIKSRSFKFTGPDDYPYPTAFVGAVRRWRERQIPPCAVVLLSEVTSRAVVVAVSTRDQWVIERRRDSHRGFVEESYAVPRRLLLPWSRLVTHISADCPLAVEVNAA